LIKKSKLNNPPVKAALYYVQLKTHNDSCLFELPTIAVSNAAPNDVSNDVPGRASSLKPSPVVSIVQIAVDELLLAAEHSGITLEQWVVLPNALHVLIALQDYRHDGLGERSRSAFQRNRKAFQGDRSTTKPRILTAFVARFKAATAKRINLLRNQPGSLVWQRSYSEQLIEDNLMLSRLQHNIRNLKEIVISSQ
jgi:REP element-mobilizing transposase RayT